MGALKIDPLPGGVGRDEDRDVLVLSEGVLRLATVLPAHPAVDRDNCLVSSEEGSDALGQVIERVPVLGEDDQLPSRSPRIEHLLLLLQELRELVPLAIRPRSPDLRCKSLEFAQTLDLELELGDRPRGG